MASRKWQQIGFWAMLGVCVALTSSGAKLLAEETDQSADKPQAKVKKLDLSSSRQAGTVWKVTSKFEVGGDLTVAGEKKKIKKLPMSVVAHLNYEERVLESSPRLRSVRHYDRAEATIKVGRGGLESKLDPQHQQVLVKIANKPTATDARISISSPASELSRDELDLLNVVGNSLVLADLLPESPVGVGEYWSHSPDTIAALVGIEAVASCEVQSVIGSVDGSRVSLSLAGTILGASEGTATEIELKANYQFDLKTRQITQFNLAIQEKRPMGHVSPGVDVTAKLAMRIERLEEANHLTQEAIANLPSSRKQDSTLLVLESSNGTYRLRHDAKWFITNETSKQLVLRRVDRGDLIAQCNLRPLTKTKPSRHLTLEQFQKDVRFTLGDRLGEFVAAGQRENKLGYREFRIVARGKVKGLPIEWRYYLLADRHGNRVSGVFTIDTSLVKQFGDADRALIAGVTLLNKQPPSKTASSELPSAPEPAIQPTARRSTGQTVR